MRQLSNVVWNTDSTLLRFSSLIGQSGRRTRSVSKIPSCFRQALTGTGFGSMKRVLEIALSFLCQAAAVLRSPESAAFTSAVTSNGKALDATEITPSAPAAMKGRVRLSSPLSTTISSPMACLS